MHRRTPLPPWLSLTSPWRHCNWILSFGRSYFQTASFRLVVLLPFQTWLTLPHIYETSRENSWRSCSGKTTRRSSKTRNPNNFVPGFFDAEVWMFLQVQVCGKEIRKLETNRVNRRRPWFSQLGSFALIVFLRFSLVFWGCFLGLVLLCILNSDLGCVILMLTKYLLTQGGNWVEVDWFWLLGWVSEAVRQWAWQLWRLGLGLQVEVQQWECRYHGHLQCKRSRMWYHLS